MEVKEITELKNIISNMDLQEYVEREDVTGIAHHMTLQGFYGFTMAKIAQATRELREEQATPAYAEVG